MKFVKAEGEMIPIMLNVEHHGVVPTWHSVKYKDDCIFSPSEWKTIEWMNNWISIQENFYVKGQYQISRKETGFITSTQRLTAFSYQLIKPFFSMKRNVHHLSTHCILSFTLIHLPASEKRVKNANFLEDETDVKKEDREKGKEEKEGKEKHKDEEGEIKR